MEPFDFEDLKKRWLAAGLPAVEGLAEIMAKEFFAWSKDSCAAHPNMLVKSLGLPAVAVLEPLAMGAIDKIDGQPG